MATKVKTAKKSADVFNPDEVKNDWQRLVVSIRDYPVFWGAGVLFVVVCLVAGLVYRVSASTATRTEMTQFAKAVDTEDAAMRATELQQLDGAFAGSAVYMAGEAAYQAKDYAKAKELFTRLRNDFPQSKFVPDAVEGLGFVAENEGDLDGALAAYKEVIEKWPTSLARRRQDLNVARVQEKKGNFKEAVDAYNAIKENYPESSFMPDVTMALDKLKLTHPDLFPAEPEAAAETTAPAEGTAPAAPTATAPALEAPAAPAAAAPAPEAPAAPAAPAPAPEAPAETPAQQ